VLTSSSIRRPDRPRLTRASRATSAGTAFAENPARRHDGDVSSIDTSSMSCSIDKIATSRGMPLRWWQTTRRCRARARRRPVFRAATFWMARQCERDLQEALARHSELAGRRLALGRRPSRSSKVVARELPRPRHERIPERRKLLR